MNGPPLTDAERFPLLTEAGQRLLFRLREHPHAPIWRFPCGDRLDAAGLARVRAFAAALGADAGSGPAAEPAAEAPFAAAAEVADPTDRRSEVPRCRHGGRSETPVSRGATGPSEAIDLARLDGLPRGLPAAWTAGTVPEWLPQFVARMLRQVPFYRDWGVAIDPADLDAAAFSLLPTTARADLAAAPWAFVPDDQPLDDLCVYHTSGTTTNRPLEVLSHPVVSSLYLAVIQSWLCRQGIRFGGDPTRVALLNVCAQAATYTHATVSAYLGDAGYAKINLAPSEWRRADDAVAFIDDCAPEVVTGDPVSLAALAALPVRIRPVAVLSSAATLLPGLRDRLAGRFGCPVFDVYSLNECRAISVATDLGHRLLAPDVYVEILDPAGESCPPGVVGEIALTGGRNPFLPLLRYRTGDRAALAWPDDGMPVLVGLDGRAPVRFARRDGSVVHPLDVAQALGALPLTAFQLRQETDLRLRFRFRVAEATVAAVRAALESVFGLEHPLELAPLTDGELAAGKLVPYLRMVEGAEAVTGVGDPAGSSAGIPSGAGGVGSSAATPGSPVVAGAFAAPAGRAPVIPPTPGGGDDA